MEVTDNSSALETTTADVSTESPISSASTDVPNTSTNVLESGIEAAVQSTPPTYTPNLKYKAGKEERELPEYLKSVISDEKRERELKEVWEKAQGIDFVKNERARIQEEYKQYRSQADPLMGIAQKVDYFRQRGDVLGMASQIGLTPEQLIKAAVQYVERKNLPQDQQAVYDQHQQEATRAYELEQALQAQQSQYEQLLTRQVENEVKMALSTPEIAPIVQAFDQRNGEGAFREQMKVMGEYHYAKTGRDLEANELAQKIITQFGLSTPTQNQMISPQINPPTQMRTPGVLPVIPNTGSGQVSPAGRKPQSLDDLKKIRAEKFGSY